MADIAYVNAGARAEGTALTNLTPAWPASMTVGNTLIITWIVKGDLSLDPEPTLTAANKILLLTNFGAAPTEITHYTAYRTVTGGETGTGPDLSWTTAFDAFAQVAQYSGVRTTGQPGDAYTNTFGTVNPHTVTGFNTVDDKVMVLYIDGAFGGSTALGTETGFTQHFTSSGTTPAGVLTVGGKLITPAGATGNISENGYSGDWGMLLTQLIPPISNTYALTGNAATGAVGSLTTSRTIALTGTSGTGAAGTIGPARSLALTGNAATGNVGTVTLSSTIALTGAAGTGAAGTVGLTLAPAALTGNAATGNVGTVVATRTIPLIGNQATGAAGSLSPSASVGLTGNQGAGSVGAIGNIHTIALTGVSGTGSVGNVSVVTSGGAVIQPMMFIAT